MSTITLISFLGTPIAALPLLMHMALLSQLPMLLLLLLQAAAASSDGLKYDYYTESCPEAEEIVRREVEKVYSIHGNAAVSFTRNIFHDCAVQGCDGSLLLESNEGHVSELESDKNFGLRNFKYLVDWIKTAVEAKCPGVVSCADILILAGRDGIAMLGGPQFQVKTGRKDTRDYDVTAADAQLLAPDADVTTFLNSMSRFGLNVPQAVALLGAHTVGRTHCKHLINRLYPDVDPTLNATYSSYLKMRCPTPNPDPNAVLYSRNDPITPMKFDNNYFMNVMQLKGLLKLDNALYLDQRTKVYVEKYASDNNYFFDQFVEAMSILTEHQVLTGSQGEIRKQCKSVN